MRKPKVGIIGLLPRQASILNREFGKKLNIQYWNDAKTSVLKSLGLSCDVVFVHASHASHNSGEILRSVKANARVVMGGMAKMRSALSTYQMEVV